MPHSEKAMLSTLDFLRTWALQDPNLLLCSPHICCAVNSYKTLHIYVLICTRNSFFSKMHFNTWIFSERLNICFNHVNNVFFSPKYTLRNCGKILKIAKMLFHDRNTEPVKCSHTSYSRFALKRCSEDECLKGCRSIDPCTVNHIVLISRWTSAVLTLVL